ncbi:MAG: DUF4446 domain-containing protein [Candidatus Doudnabacteria bacterium CG10_big_fil_rev_8_21_14_0_10_41_10]|uniref:DUF4446 domain-containing protein n=1 Tax=Candidatus Doudnabacteria bacterium CG10_big_fil_rev_8_21_14_0_10_41_10 TaxID=1974551 RepID=A0A2H0VEJ2_9BACT|nr:MAG: DUF4446 domain-containing protein [Candidatus Doudnabacteria bacterium CG10_big_fil_rev_8_21_14_0_10_41_10]
MPYNLIIFEIIAIVLGLLSLILVLVFLSKLRSLQKFQKSFLSGARGTNLEEIIMSQREDVKKSLEDIKKLSQANKILADLHLLCIQKVGMVRFSAFPGEGGNQSFAIALLDAYGTGVVISSIYGRDTQRIFAKSVKKGESTNALTDEEKKAILQSHSVEEQIELAGEPQNESFAKKYVKKATRRIKK